MTASNVACPLQKAAHLELRHKLPDKVTIGVVFAPKGDGAVDSVVLVEECAGRQPHPVCVVQAPVIVYQQPIKDIPASCPGAIQISTCEEAGYSMTRQVVHPTLNWHISTDLYIQVQ